MPIAQNIKKDVVVTTSSYEKENHEDTREILFKRTTGQLLNFYIGASF
jgi:hypothetical protein